MDLSLCRVVHIREELSANIKHNAADWNKSEQQPAHGSSAENMIGNIDEIREITSTVAAYKLVGTDCEEVKANRKVTDTNPGVCQATSKAFTDAFAAGKCRPAAVDQ